MIDFRDRESFIPNLVSVSSVVALAGGLVVMLLPGPRVDPKMESNTRKKETEYRIQAQQFEDAYNASHQAVQANTWTGLPQEVNAAVLQRVTALVQAHNLKLSSFRPQRDNKVDDLSTLPYLMIVEGAFPDVLAFERDIEKAQNRLAPSLLQIASSDTNSDRVTANIIINAFLNPAPAVPTLDKQETTTRA